MSSPAIPVDTSAPVPPSAPPPPPSTALQGAESPPLSPVTPFVPKASEGRPLLPERANRSPLASLKASPVPVEPNDAKDPVLPTAPTDSAPSSSLAAFSWNVDKLHHPTGRLAEGGQVVRVEREEGILPGTLKVVYGKDSPAADLASDAKGAGAQAIQLSAGSSAGPASSSSGENKNPSADTSSTAKGSSPNLSVASPAASRNLSPGF